MVNANGKLTSAFPHFSSKTKYRRASQVILRHSHLVFLSFYVPNYIFVFLHAHFSYCFRILFTHGDLYSVRFFRIILLCLISFVKVSQEKGNIGVSECIRLTSIPSLRSSFSFPVLHARKSHNVCKCLSLSDCISSAVLRFPIPSTSKSFVIICSF